jgi:hypothetical protein
MNAAAWQSEWREAVASLESVMTGQIGAQIEEVICLCERNAKFMSAETE